MEDSFKVRIDKTFGTLSPQQQSSLWSLTDEEIQHNKWIPPKPKPQNDDNHLLKNPKKPFSPFLQSLIDQPSSSSASADLQADIQELGSDEDDDSDSDDGGDKGDKGEMGFVKPDDHNNEEWDIRASVGLDCTLDNEEEEDCFDKVAVGTEESAERFYMKDANDYEVEMDSNIVLPGSLTDVIKDPRANHKAAKLRIKEDYESAKKLGACDVPDHVLNPSRYTHYTFDSDEEVDEESNRKACMDFLNTLKGSAAMEIQEDVSTDSLKSIVFTPKKKSGDGLMTKGKVDGNEENMHKKFISVSIEDSEVCMMDEDEPVINKGSSLQKGARRYRTKASIDE
ncbi:hypothetical protein CTI12_AA000200 [Artemisia annua]|uniref:U5 small nuclear ribonucleoprotein TSSC4 n=1 Tax=Artemisia annua TaxID=35608 RepID=A0A2U1QJM5_ARTAN|nr:hypothetical protein CTI12_AA000200 [Artemisia annua]